MSKRSTSHLVIGLLVTLALCGTAFGWGDVVISLGDDYSTGIILCKPAGCPFVLYYRKDGDDWQQVGGVHTCGEDVDIDAIGQATGHYTVRAQCDQGDGLYTDAPNGIGSGEIGTVTVLDAILGQPSAATIRMITSWTSVPSGSYKCQFTLSTDPAGHEDHTTVVIESVTPGTNPTGTGTIALENGYWVYRAMAEPTSEKHPQSKQVVLRAKVDNVACPTSSRTITVLSVYDYLLMPEPDEDAMSYAVWKYSVPTGNITLHLDPYGGDDARTTLANNTYLGPDRLRHSENWTAYTIGHENVHGGQSYYLRWLAQGGAQPESLRLYWEALMEIPAYQWGLDNADTVGLTEDEVNVVHGAFEFFIRQMEENEP